MYEDGLIAEHWDNLAALAEPNPSGHTQTDGTMEIADLDKTEENRELVKNFLVDVMADAEGITEELKAMDQLAWVGRMNSIRQQAEENVLRELVFD